MAKRIKADICVIGAGSGGLSVAAGAAQMGARTVLIERDAMGGDCLNTGCVPSKALLAAAKQAYRMGAGEPFGIAPVEAKVDFAKVHEHVHGVIGTIAPNDSVARFEGLGVTVIKDYARFRDGSTVLAGNAEIAARRFVIATGSRASAPPIPGLDKVPFYTNENIFENKECPAHLIVIGGGPIGMEMAQAHRRLGARVTVLEGARVLSREDPELSAVVVDRLRRDGVEILEGAKVLSVSGAENNIAVEIVHGQETRRIEGSHLLVATGRRPNVEDLGLEKAGVEYTERGLKLDERLRTTNKRIFGIGDVTGGLQFTHVANYHAGIVIRNALFRVPARADHHAVPWVTYTDPELAHVGETEEEARKRYSKINVLRWHMAENDRAQAERETEGVIKVITDSHARVLGATIVGPHAGELILPWVLAKSNALKLSAMASVIVPYPTLSEISKRAAGAYYTPALYSSKTRMLVRFLSLFG
ncbi:FAD-dependent oxidoreductase [Parvibaculum sp.]|jgi:pyruvate/2-oxoglutarate dehydrogenase complex dihydrolipoamide dehydrogenase (E3) component|uniref:dihydrolipoyl dehydrogenase family protein n=1 Tax=Parvibaculum sp. TaxID=2024848 RepID=UPI000C6979E8|nr:FAD-dependent oxidoreductase [Parvibaculum sp.]MAM95068.1 dihydrolipoamide dehydrogenase [Parvibaculum sp.]|tara:strand:- start:14158 stop:15582 length:1425 start_codon:yes stop_codon:yes gene_type:complete